MRSLFILVFGIAVVVVSRPTSAELVIYKGTIKQTGVGLGITRKITSQYYMIVDYDTADVGQIQYTTVNKAKEYSTHTITNLHFVQINASKGKTGEAISHLPNDCGANQGSTSESVFVEGADGALTVSPGKTITNPKMFSGGGTQISQSNFQPVYVQSGLVVSFDAGQTALSNGNGETLDAAMARLSSTLEGQGYYRQSESKGSLHPLDLMKADSQP
jgi:hypothetical protein